MSAPYKLEGKDYDNCGYELYVDGKQGLHFSWETSFFNEIWAHGGEQMIAKYYPEYKLVAKDDSREGYDMTMSYDLSNFKDLDFDAKKERNEEEKKELKRKRT